MLFQMLQSTAESHPNKTAIQYDEEEINYGRLRNTCITLSGLLQQTGINSETPVALILPNSPEYLYSYFSLAYLNAIAVPLNHELKNNELDFYVKEADIKFILTSRKDFDRIRDFYTGKKEKIQVIDTSMLTNTGQASDLTGILQTVTETTESYSDRDFLYQYSSGTTGLPKRIMRTQKNCVDEVINFTATCNISSEDRIFCSIPLFHAHGMFNCMVAAIKSGATLIMMANLQPFVLHRQRVMEMIESQRVSIFPGIPFQFESLVKIKRKFDLSSIRLCFTAGSKLQKNTFEEFLAKYNVPIRQLYGSTETGSLCINLDKDIRQSWSSVGKPILNVQVQVWDDEGRELPPEAEGEVAVNSPAMTHGYYNHDELNKSVFKNGFFLTGDLGRLSTDGRLQLTGRKRQFIEVVGHKVDPATIEKVLLQNPAISEAVVLGVTEDKTNKEQIKAIIVTDKSCSHEELLTYCRRQLASFEVPEILEIRDKIERDSAGKVQIKRLAD